ncbi:hypothetical protein LSAT2_024957 [Lamellibrachia satsuma]|nr:hypothetical protein LSAT2_024957 [Lamellibrachia satsuma]
MSSLSSLQSAAFSQVALCQKLRVIQQEYNDLITKMHSFDDHFMDAMITCSTAKLTRPTSFENRDADVELSVENYTSDSIEPYIKLEHTPTSNPNVSVIPVANNLSLRHHSSEGDVTLNPLQSTMSYPQNSTQVEQSFAMDTPCSRKLNFVDNHNDSDSEIDVDISYDDTNPHVYRVRREAISQYAVQSPVMISAISMDLSESYTDTDSSMVAHRSSMINLASILCDENVVKVVRRSSTRQSRRRSVPVQRVARNTSVKSHHTATHHSLDSPTVPNNTQVNRDVSLNSDATYFMDTRLAPTAVTHLVRKDSRRRSIVKKLRHIGKQLRSKNKVTLKTLAVV